MIDEKLAIIKENNQKVFDAGKFKTLNKSKYMHPTVSGMTVVVNDVNSMEHKLGVRVTSKNLLPYPYYNTTQTISGITYTVGADGSLTIEGTATANATFNFILASYDSALPLKAGDYTFSLGTPNTDYSQFRLGTIDENGTIVVKANIKYAGIKEEAFTLEKDARIYMNCIVGKGDTVPKTTFYPQIELGTTATEYTPYVADLSGVEVSRYGKNLLPYSYYETTKIVNGITFTNNGDGTITVNGTATTNADFYLYSSFEIKKGMVVSSGLDGDSGRTYEVFVNSFTDTLHSYGNYRFATTDFTSTTIFIRIRPGFTANNLVFKPQIEYNTVVTAYEPYKEPQTATASADGIVEGLISLSPNMTLLTDTEGVTINCQYYRDIDTYINNLATNIALTGGN